ncbi:hypothetical protein J6590_104282 [Homalodisca vitripennis]|nr:hypothetical protein J6590_104282 [Homalodisca vitripennis]
MVRMSNSSRQVWLVFSKTFGPMSFMLQELGPYSNRIIVCLKQNNKVLHRVLNLGISQTVIRELSPQHLEATYPHVHGKRGQGGSLYGNTHSMMAEFESRENSQSKLKPSRRKYRARGYKIVGVVRC